jgi:hypothetical protein
VKIDPDPAGSGGPTLGETPCILRSGTGAARFRWWLRVTPTSGGAGRATITVKAYGAGSTAALTAPVHVKAFICKPHGFTSGGGSGGNTFDYPEEVTSTTSSNDKEVYEITGDEDSCFMCLGTADSQPTVLLGSASQIDGDYDSGSGSWWAMFCPQLNPGSNEGDDPRVPYDLAITSTNTTSPVTTPVNIDDA